MQCFVYQSAYGIIDINPYGMKIAVILKINKIAHKLIYQPYQNESPTGLLPYIIDGDMILADSQAIVEYLRYQYGLASDEVIDEHNAYIWQRLGRLCENDLYPIMVHSRMLDPSGLEVMTSNKAITDVLNSKESIERAQNKMQQLINASSVSKFTQEQRYSRGLDILYEIENTINKGILWLDNKPSTYDATVYAFLENIRAIPLPNIMNKYLHKSAIIGSYLAKVKSFL